MRPTSQVVPFGEWAPDKPALVLGQSGGLYEARGVVPISGGYAPMLTFLDAGLSALTARARGGGCAIDKAGNTFNLAGDATKLYTLTASGVTDVSRAVGGAYTLGATDAWEFAVYNNIIIATDLKDLPQQFDLGIDTDFSDTTGAPKAAHVAVIEDFVVLGNLDDAGTIYHQGVQWCAQGNPTSWPTPGTDAALEVLAGRQPALGGEGKLQRIIGGPEVGLVLLEGGLFRMDFVGGDVAFQFTRIEDGYGLLAPGAACGKGRIVMYLHEGGWRLSDFGASKPVGKGRIDRWFLNDLDPSSTDRITMVADPESTRFFVGYRSSSASDTNCDRILCYDYELDEFTRGDQAHEILCRTLELTQTLDSLGGTSLDVEPLASASLDDLGPVGAGKLGGYSTAHKLQRFAGGAQAAVFETGDLALFGKRTGLLQEVRPLLSGASASAQASGIFTPEGTHSFSPVGNPNRLGVVPLRVPGRFHRVRLNVAAASGLRDVTGLEVTATAGGYG